MNICLGLVLVGSKTLALAFLVTIFWILTRTKIQIKTQMIAASFDIELIVVKIKVPNLIAKGFWYLSSAR